MLHASTKRLIDTLGDRTRKQRVGWVESENGAVTHDTEGYRVIITPEPHTVLITDALGKELDEVTPEEYADVVDEDGRPYARFVNELFREASRHARGTERAIEALLAGLDKDGDGIPDDQQAAPVDIEETIEDIGDETHFVEDESTRDMKNAVANLADQVNGDASHVPDADFAEAGEPAIPGSDASASIISAGAAAAAATAAATAFGSDQIEPAAPELDVPERDVSDEADMQFNQAADDLPEPPAPAAIDPETLASLASAETPPAVPQDNQFLNTGNQGKTMKMSTSFGDVVEYRSESADVPEAAPVSNIPELSGEVSDDVLSAAQPLSDTEQTISDALAGLTDEPAPDSPMDASHTAAKPARSFSLSGIGTGFGLGATTGAVAAGLQGEADEVAEAVQEQASDAAESLKDSAIGFVDGTSDLPDAAIQPQDIEGIGSAASKGFESAQDAATDLAEDAGVAADSVRSGVGGLLGGLVGKAREGADAVKDVAENAADAATEAAEDAGEAVKPAAKATKRFNPWT